MAAWLGPRVAPVDVAIADAAADILRDRALVRPDELSLPDAVHLASAFVTGADAVITNDSAWIDLAPRGLRVIILDDLVAAVSML